MNCGGGSEALSFEWQKTYLYVVTNLQEIRFTHLERRRQIRAPIRVFCGTEAVFREQPTKRSR